VLGEIDFDSNEEEIDITCCNFVELQKVLLGAVQKVKILSNLSFFKGLELGILLIVREMQNIEI